MDAEDEDYEGWWMDKLGHIPPNEPVNFDDVKAFVRKNSELNLMLLLYIGRDRNSIAPVTCIGKGAIEIKLLIVEEATDPSSEALDDGRYAGDGGDETEEEEDGELSDDVGSESSSEDDEAWGIGERMQPSRKRSKLARRRAVMINDDVTTPFVIDHFLLIDNLESLLNMKSQHKTVCKFCLARFTNESRLLKQHEEVCRLRDGATGVAQQTTFGKDPIEFTRHECTTRKQFRGYVYLCMVR